MKRILTILLCLPTLASAADTYTIKLKKRDQGDTLAVETEEKASANFIFLGPDGKEVNKVNDQTTTIAKYREAVMEKPAGKRPSKLKRTYDQASIGTMNLPYHGKTIVIQKVGEAFKFVMDGKELKGDDAGPLPKEFSDPNKAPDDGEKNFLPKKPVAVGDTWSPDIAETFKGAFEDGGTGLFDLTKASAQGKLVKVYQKEKLTFGVLEINLSAPLKTVPGFNFPCDAGALFTLKMTLDVCIDGKEETGTLKAEMKLSGMARTLDGKGKETGGKLKFEIAAVTTDSKLQYFP